ncbi:hypothetical protein QBZ16_000085 [Prototheca wickerhamii]|uniref:Uncharacterized protein n=1 Tax=Prototheca wickerhamii TaxID=3111 RepID=A0AAD9IPI7_PROWI|nr:hypothetical protein QBZ16_000085 [Prototheca wickerhamii]
MAEYGAGRNGFTPAQLEVLRNQIVVYRQLKGSKGASAAAGATPAANGDAKEEEDPPELIKAPRKPLVLQAQARGPLYELSDGPVAVAAAKPAPGQAPPPSLPTPVFSRAAVLPLLHMELQRLARRGLDSLRASSEGSLAAGSGARPGFAWRAGDAMPRGTALLTRKALGLLERQRALRAAVEAAQAEISSMAPAKYRSLVRAHRAQRIETARRELAGRAELAARRARDAKQARSDALAARWSALRDGLAARNKGVATAHARLARERNKARVDERTMRMEAIRAHDFEAYQELLRAQAVGAADQKYEAISRFLRETEEYLLKLAGKIAGVKLSAEVSKATSEAIVAARGKGLSEEEVQAAARAAAQEAAAASVAARAAGAGAGGAAAPGAPDDARSRYYALAHSNRESVAEQPSLLRPPGGARLREYQLVGLQWMVSLYNNHLNGILADEMGLGKTVQVMALIAFLMEHKSNFGPHLIIVPNAVLVNWKSELSQWLPSARCVYYVGAKEERARKYAHEVQSLQFNILVTTYEFVMRDTSRLAKIDWQYIIIDEAQRMKDRESKLAKDLDKFTAARRLLLSGTPLQNDLLELWSLLNLLLPEVFDDKKMFAEWFGGSAAGNNGGEADWLEKERRVVVIHRLHQILEPFMLRRQVEDVETKLPPKVAVEVRVPFTPFQAAIYDWVKATGTIRLDPADPRAARHRRAYHTLTNKCMELRKLCNHPLLTYPPPDWGVGEAIVRQCGKLLVLDRVLIKLVATGHRVLLFSTMTRLLDLLEVYLRWRTLPPAALAARRELENGETPLESFRAQPIVRQERADAMGYLRIDGTTSLEDREAAIRAFNAPGSAASVFLLSIRAAGRGLNLQSADSVVIYDPDPNPKNEEQAIARSHRIGQTKEVRVIHLESVADPSRASVLSASPTLCWLKSAPEEAAPPTTPTDAPAVHTTQSPPPPLTPAAPPLETRLYADSIESLVRHQIQRVKIDMANEVIDAGRFDQQTSNDERRQTLEALLQDEARTNVAQNTVLSWRALNAQLARGERERALFDRLDAEVDWMDPTSAAEVPGWMRWSREELAAAVRRAAAERSRHPPDLQAEMAALTGTVHHAPGAAAPSAQAGEPARPRRISIKLARVASEPDVSAATAAEDDTAVAALEGDTEEEDVELGADILEDNDDATTTQTGAGASAGKRPATEDLRHVESTAHFTPSPFKRPRADGDGPSGS